MRNYKKERGTSMVHAVRSSSKYWNFAIKKRLGGAGAAVGLTAYVKYENIGGGTKSLNGIPVWRHYFQLLIGNACAELGRSEVFLAWCSRTG